MSDVTRDVVADGQNSACENTDRHLWPLVSDRPDADSIHVTKDGGIGINVGGHVIAMTLRKWFSAALACGQEPIPEFERPTLADVERARAEERERCAKVIEDWPTWDVWRSEGAAAIRSLGPAPTPAPSLAIPEGWKLVPVEPTQGMTDAWWRTHFATAPDASNDRAAYRAMLSASPSPAVQADSVTEMREALEDAQYSYDGALEDLRSMGAHLMVLLVRPEEARKQVAWWMCANYPCEVFQAPMYRDIRALAESYNTPPRGGTWEEWFSRDVVARAALSAAGGSTAEPDRSET